MITGLIANCIEHLLLLYSAMFPVALLCVFQKVLYDQECHVMMKPIGYHILLSSFPSSVHSSHDSQHGCSLTIRIIQKEK